MTGIIAGDNDWQPVKIGAGGWLTGIDIAKDGTMVVRTDTYGAYIWDGNELAAARDSLQHAERIRFARRRVRIKIAPSDSNILYMETGNGVYKSIDKGETWVRTSFPTSVLNPNLNNRMDGQKMAIDPNNSNVVFAGTQKDGLWVTRDGGLSWEKVLAVPQGTNTSDPGLTGIVIQGANVYVGTAGSGVYSSNDGGLTWSAIGGPADIGHAVIAADGSYFATGNTDRALWKYADGIWTKLIASDVHTIAIDPFDPAHIIVTNSAGNLGESKDGGLTFYLWNRTTQLELSADIPWLETTELWMSPGGVMFDPLVPGKLWMSGGVGVWHTNLPSNMTWSTPIVWNSQSAGIEQLVANDIIAPAGGNPVFASWDRAFFNCSRPRQLRLQL